MPPRVLVTRTWDPPQRGSQQPKWDWLSLNKHWNSNTLIKYAYTQGGACLERTPVSAGISHQPVGCSKGPSGAGGDSSKGTGRDPVTHIPVRRDRFSKPQRGALLQSHTVVTGFLHCSHFC